MEPGRVVGGRFRVERFVGAGGMGSVYLATDTSPDALGLVALKVLRVGSGAQVARFAAEARLLAELHHPAIVRYVAHGKASSGEDYLAMEWLDGEDLAQRLKRGRIAPTETVAIARRAAQGLGVAHARGVLHRDIKPNNLFLPGGNARELKVIDFGIAQRLAAPTGLTESGMLMGTPGYMAPEQARAERLLDARADVFSLGCVLFECLAGQAPFVADHWMAVLAKIVFEEAPRVRELVRDVPSVLDDLVARMMAKDPADRPADGRAVLAELDAIGTDVTAAFVVGLAPPTGPQPATTLLTRREQALVSLVVAASPEEPDDPLGPTVALSATRHAELRDLVASTGAELEVLADGSLVAVLRGRTSAKDQVAQAARCALALAEALPDGPVVLCTGRGELATRLPVGDAIDRAVRTFRAARATAKNKGRVLLDEVTAGLLPARFEVVDDAGERVLRGERGGDEGPRTLLGCATPCVGRDQELVVLRTLFNHCVGDPGPRVALLTGAPGIGKSRVRYEFARELAARGEACAVWIANGDPMTAGSPLGLVAELLRGAFGVQQGEAPERTRRRMRERLRTRMRREDADRVESFLGEVLGVPPLVASSRDPVGDAAGDEPLLAAARRDPQLMADQIRRAWLDWLEAECSAQPVVIVLEDLHHGDLPTVKLVDAALRDLSGSALLVLGCARPEVHELFPDLWSTRGVVAIALGELTKSASIELATSVLGDDLDAPAISKLAERAGGNAFYLEELIRASAEGTSDALPDTVLAMVEGRFSAFDDDARRVMRAASVFGQVFWRGGIVALLGQEFEVAAREWLDELGDREVVVRRRASKFAGEIEYAFRHALLREAAYSTLVDADRTLGHRLAAAWLEQRGDRDARALAAHFDLGGEPARAVPLFVRAAEEALERNDLAGAVACADNGARCGAAGNELGALRLAEAEARIWLGDFSAAERAGNEALELVPAGSARWYASAGAVVAAAATLGHHERVTDLVVAVGQSSPDRGATPAGLAAAARMASHLAANGRTEPADRLLAWIALVSGDATLDDLTLGHVELARGVRAGVGGDLGTFLGAMQRSALSFARAGHLRRACSAQANAGLGSAELGRYAEAEETLRRALQAAERAGLPNAAAYAQHNLGGVLLRRGALAEACALELAAIGAAVAQGDKRLECVSRNFLARALRLAGDSAGATREARAACSLSVATPPLRASALSVLAEIHLGEGRTDDAHREAAEALAIVEQLGGIEDGESLVRLVHAEALRAFDPSAARAAVERARDRILERSRMIQDPELCRSFLEQVPENARTLHLAHELGVSA